MTIIIILAFILLWGDYLEKFLTIISFISAGFTIALRDLIFNFFSGIYIKIKRPFEIEDRIEINNYKGDVININALNFEVLEFYWSKYRSNYTYPQFNNLSVSFKKL